MIIVSTKLTTSGRHSHPFVPSYSTNSDTETLQPFIADLCFQQKKICNCCERIGHKADACTIRGPKFLPPSLRRNINQFNDLYVVEKNDPPRDCNSQPPAVHFRSRTSPPQISPLVSAIIWRLNYHDVNNGDVQVYPLEYPFEPTSEFLPYPDTTQINSIDDD